MSLEVLFLLFLSAAIVYVAISYGSEKSNKDTPSKASILLEFFTQNVNINSISKSYYNECQIRKGEELIKVRIPTGPYDPPYFQVFIKTGEADFVESNDNELNTELGTAFYQYLRNEEEIKEKKERKDRLDKEESQRQESEKAVLKIRNIVEEPLRKREVREKMSKSFS